MLVAICFFLIKSLGINEFFLNFRSISCTFDYLVERTAITPNYIKIDVDGNELQIIKGMTETLKNKELKSICIELNPEFKEHKEVFDILKNNFNKYEKKNWYYGQIVFNHIFYKI